LLEEASAALEGVGDVDADDLLAIVRSELLVHRGKRRAACAALEASTAPSSSVRGIVHARLATALAAAGELERAEAVMASCEPSDDPRIDAEIALAEARLALAQRDTRRSRASLSRAAAHAARERVGFELRTRTIALEVEIEEAAGRRAEGRAALGRLRAALEPALRSLPVELQSRFRQIPGHRRALAEGAASTGELASTAERALDGLATLAAEPRLDQLDDRLAEIALALATAERAFVIEWTETGLVVRGRAGTARADAHARPSSAIALRALREHLVVSTDAVHERDASSSVHALALRSVLAVELTPRLPGAGPRVLVVDDPLRAGAFDAGVVSGMRALTDVAGPLLAARAEARRARRRERRAEKREAALEADARRHRASDDAEDAAIDPFASFVHAEASTARLVEEARRLASSELPLLLVGESGVGKDLLARAIHRASPRRHEPLVSERGGELAGSLSDATLFGHVRGAFTGAESARKGLFELADGGTLLLDGIEDIPLEVQAKLLRILVEGEVRPLGASRGRRVDVRVLATTRHAPHESIARGALREDFYYRVAGAVLVLPPLRERPRDLDALLTRALARAGRDIALSSRARDALHARRWPGNVRELDHALTEALLRTTGAVLDLASLTADAGAASSAARERAVASLHEQRGALTRELVLATLEAHHGNRTHAARALGVSRFGLQKMLRRFSEGAAGSRAHDEK
jgi:DNA-binding NtrC family response regulator